MSSARLSSFLCVLLIFHRDFAILPAYVIAHLAEQIAHADVDGAVFVLAADSAFVAVEGDFDLSFFVDGWLVRVGLRRVPIGVGFDLGDLGVDGIEEGLPVQFGAVWAFGLRVPIVLVDFVGGPAVLDADPGDVFDGVLFGAVELIVAVIHAAGDLDADEVAVGETVGTVAGVECVAAERDALDGFALIDDGVETGGAAVVDHVRRFGASTGAAGGVVGDDADWRHGVRCFEAVLIFWQPELTECVGHGHTPFPSSMVSLVMALVVDGSWLTAASIISSTLFQSTLNPCFCRMSSAYCLRSSVA